MVKHFLTSMVFEPGVFFTNSTEVEAMLKSLEIGAGLSIPLSPGMYIKVNAKPEEIDVDHDYTIGNKSIVEVFYNLAKANIIPQGIYMIKTDLD